MFSEGRLVTCLDTGKIGVMLDYVYSAQNELIVLVQWNDTQDWINAVNLEVIDHS